MKRNVKKLTFSMLLTSVVLIGTSIYATNYYKDKDIEQPQQTVNTQTTKVSKTSVDETKKDNIPYGKSIEVVYSSLNEIPETYYYEEFNTKIDKWLSGNLKRVSLSQIAENKYIVKFQGLLEVN